MEKKCYIRKLNHWFFIDTANRKSSVDYTNRKEQYPMMINDESERVYARTGECDILPGDYASRNITIPEYFMISRIIKNDGRFKYNKKLGIAVSVK